jgi:hypothetical protein
MNKTLKNNNLSNLSVKLILYYFLLFLEELDQTYVII